MFRSLHGLSSGYCIELSTMKAKAYNKYTSFVASQMISNCGMAQKTPICVGFCLDF